MFRKVLLFIKNIVNDMICDECLSDIPDEYYNHNFNDIYYDDEI